MAILRARDLTKTIDTGTHRVEILRGMNLDIPAGQFVAIMGASGSGKSTLLGLLAGLDTPTSGQIIIDGVDITNLNEDALALVRGQKIGFVFQSYQLIPTLTAEENVLLPHELTGGDLRAGLARARELLTGVGLEDRMDHYPVQLSGGEQQRVAIARALANRPALLLADEPTGNLDPETSDGVFAQLVGLAREHGLAALIATHNPALAARMDRTVRLEHGVLTSVG